MTKLFGQFVIAADVLKLRDQGILDEIYYQDRNLTEVAVFAQAQRSRGDVGRRGGQLRGSVPAGLLDRVMG